MNKNYVFLGAVLDRSGSMSGDKIVEARGGFNSLIDDKKTKDYKSDVYLTIFDNKIETLYSGDITECPVLDESNFFARGMTNLLDAIGVTINEIGKILDEKNEDDKPIKVIITIITDGFENNSTEFTGESLSKLIKKQKDDYSWEFIFMGTDESTIQNAKDMGINNTLHYDNSAKGVDHAYRSYSCSIDSIVDSSGIDNKE